MKTNLKRILAVLLSLALVFSLGLTGLTANAEDTEIAGETYFVLADGTDCGWVNPGNNVKSGMTGQLAWPDYANRVTPQFVKTGAHIWLGAKNYIEAGVNAADVKTVSIYLKNDMDTTLTYRLARSTEDTKYGADNSIRYWNLSGGWAYLCDTQGYVLPVFVEGGWLNVPAGFEGYVLYDLSTFAAAEKLAATDFTAMAFDIKNTKEMLKQAWYFSEIAVSYDDVETLKELYMTEGFILSDGTNAVSEHPAVFAPFDFMPGAFTIGYTVLEDGKTKYDGNLKVPFYDWAKSTDCIGGLNDAKGFSFRVDISCESEVSLAPCINGQINNLVGGTIYMLGDDGSISIVTDTERDGIAIKTKSFSGTVYVFPDEIETTWGSTTYADWKSVGFSTVNFYTRNDAKAQDGHIIFGNISYVYDEESIVNSVYENASIVLNDGSNIPKYYNADNYTPSLINTPDTDGDAICITAVESTNGTKPNQYFLLPASASLPDASRAKTVSFKLKLPNFQGTGKTIESLTLRFNGEGGGYYCGNVTLVNFDGTVTEIASDGASATSILAPEFFDGTVILDLTGDIIKYSGEFMSFEEFMAHEKINNKITSIFAWMGMRYRSYYEQHVIFDDFRLGYKDAAVLAGELAYSDLYSRSYELNSGLGNWNHTASSGNFVAGSATATIGAGTQGSNTYAFKYLPVVDNTATAADVGIKGSGGFAELPAGIDLSSATAISYWISVPELPDGGWYNLSFGIGPNGNDWRRDTISTTVYLVDDDGTLVKTFEQKEATATAVRINEAFTGKIYYVIDENTKVYDYDLKAWYSWSDYLTNNTTPFNWFGHYVIRSSTDVNENYPFYLDDYRIHFNDGQYNNLMWLVEDEKYWADFEEELAALEAAEKAKVIFAADDLAKAKLETLTVKDAEGNNVKEVFFDREVVDMGEFGSAIHYQRIENVNGYSCPAAEVSYGSACTLSKAEIAAKEAIVTWISVPETVPVGYNIMPRINHGSNYFFTSMITANTVTGEIEYDNNYGSGKLLAPGFEGYVILPLETAVIKSNYGSGAPVSFSDYVAEKGFTGYFFYYNQQNNVDWYQGEIKFVDDIETLLLGLGATAVEGDLNYDQKTDILDFIRLKKFAAGAATQIAYQNLDVDTNGTLDIAADMVGMAKLLLGVDHTAEELIEHDKYGVHIFHSSIGDWDRSDATYVSSEYGVVNNYITSDIYEIAQARENGAGVWLYIGGKTTATDSFKASFTELVDRIKANKLWNSVLGVFYEEPNTTDEEFIALTKFVDETVGKRQLVCLATNQIGEEANAARFQYITDIGYDNYTIGLDDVVDAETGEVTRKGHRTYIEQIRTYTGLTDAPLWLFPQVYGNDTEENMIAELEMYETLIDEIDSFGGLMYYTWESWSDATPGLEELINDKDYDALAEKMSEISYKIFTME